MSDLRWTVVIRLDVDSPPRDMIFVHDKDGTPYTESRAREVFALMAVQWSSFGARYLIMLLHGANEVDRAVVGGKAMN